MQEVLLSLGATTTRPLKARLAQAGSRGTGADEGWGLGAENWKIACTQADASGREPFIKTKKISKLLTHTCPNRVNPT